MLWHMKSYFDIREFSHWRCLNIAAGAQKGQWNLSGDSQNTTEQGPEKHVVTLEIVSNLIPAPALSGMFGSQVFLSSLPN